MAAGFDPLLFWRITPRELTTLIKGATERRRLERNDQISLAWHMARLNAYAPQKARDFPKLSELLIANDQPRHPRVQSAEEQLAAARSWMANRKR